MATYFFHLLESSGWVPDHEGHCLPSIARVNAFADQMARTVMGHDLAEGRTIGLDSAIVAEDESGEEVCRVEFADVIGAAMEGLPRSPAPSSKKAR